MNNFVKGIWITTYALPSGSKYVPEGRRKVEGHNSTGKNIVSALQTEEIVGSQRTEE